MQEAYVQKYIDLFISCLDEELNIAQNGVINAVKWFNYLTTDIIGELAFGESFGGLEKNEMHPWLENLFGSLKIYSFFRELSRYPSWMAYITIALISPRRQLVHSKNAIGFGAEQAQKRIKRGTERPDFMSYLLRHTGERGSVLRHLTNLEFTLTPFFRLSEAEIAVSSITWIIAGSETSQSQSLIQVELDLY